MELATGARVRDCGKVFIELEGLDDTRGYSVESMGPDGRLPALLVRARGHHVIVVADVAKPQVVELRDSEGRAMLSIDVPPYRPGHHRKEGLAGPSEAQEQIRDIDRQPVPGETYVDVTGLFGSRDPKGTHRLRGRVEVEARRQILADEIGLKILDVEGNSVDGSDLVVLGTRHITYGDGTVVTMFEISSAIPDGLDELTWWVSIDAEDCPDGLFWVSPGYLSDLARDRDLIIHAGADDPLYDDWYQEVHSADLQELAIQRAAECDDVAFSILVLDGSDDQRLMGETIDSLIQQTYGKWQGYVPKDAAFDLADERLHGMGDEDDDPFDGLRAITGKSADGSYLAVIEAGDVLAPDFLWEMRESILAHPNARFVYCDDDHVFQGHHHDGRLKPAFDGPLYIGNDYIGHSCVFSATILDDPSVDSVSAIVFKLMDHGGTLVHVPRVLLSRDDGSSPSVIDRTSAAEMISLIGERFEAAGLSVQLREEGSLRHIAVDHGDDLRVSVVMVHRNPSSWEMNGDRLGSVGISVKDSLRCVLRQRTTIPMNVLIVDGTGELDGDLLESMGTEERPVRVIAMDGAQNASELYSAGLAESDDDIILFVEEDAMTTDWGALEGLVSCLLWPGVGAVSATSLYRDGLLRERGVILPFSGPMLLGCETDPDDGMPCAIDSVVHSASALSFGWLMARRDVIESVDGVDEKLRTAYIDADLCLRITNAGWSCVSTPDVTIVRGGLPRLGWMYPQGMYGRLNEPDEEDIAISLVRDLSRFEGVWHDYMGFGDPFYNENYLPLLHDNELYFRYRDGGWSNRFEIAR